MRGKGMSIFTNACKRESGVYRVKVYRHYQRQVGKVLTPDRNRDNFDERDELDSYVDTFVVGRNCLCLSFT